MAPIRCNLVEVSLDTLQIISHHTKARISAHIRLLREGRIGPILSSTSSLLHIVGLGLASLGSDALCLSIKRDKQFGPSTRP